MRTAPRNSLGIFDSDPGPYHPEYRQVERPVDHLRSIRNGVWTIAGIAIAALALNLLALLASLH